MADKKKALLVVDADLIPKIQRQFPATTDVLHPALVDDRSALIFTVDCTGLPPKQATELLTKYRDGTRKAIDAAYPGRKIPFLVVARAQGGETLQVADEALMATLGWFKRSDEPR